MNELLFTDAMFRYIKNHCSDDYLSRCFNKVSLKHSDNNFWDITSYLNTEIENVSIVEKLNIVMCFLKNDGVVRYKSIDYMCFNNTFLMTELVKDNLISQTEEADVLYPWIDCTEGEPFFE